MENSSGRWGWMGSRAIPCQARSGGAFKPSLVNLSPGGERPGVIVIIEAWR